MSSIDVNESHPLEQVLLRIRGDMLKNFTKKWSAHQHYNTDGTPDVDCKASIVLDGLWKLNRSKCCHDNTCLETDVGDIPTGCIYTPNKNSYFCEQHKNEQLTFNVDGHQMPVKPSEIKLSKFTSKIT